MDCLLGGFPGAPRPGPFLLLSACKQTQLVLVISPPINKKLPWAASGLLTAPVWIREQRKSKCSCVVTKAFWEELQTLCGQQKQPANSWWESNPRNIQGGLGSQGWAAKRQHQQPLEPGLKASKGKHWRELGSWGAVCSLSA